MVETRNNQQETVYREDYSLHKISHLLTTDTPILRSKDCPFSLNTEDKRKVLAFYGRNRNLWPCNKSVQNKKVEGVLNMLAG